MQSANLEIPLWISNQLRDIAQCGAEIVCDKRRVFDMDIEIKVAGKAATIQIQRPPYRKIFAHIFAIDVDSLVDLLRQHKMSTRASANTSNANSAAASTAASADDDNVAPADYTSDDNGDGDGDRDSDDDASDGDDDDNISDCIAHVRNMQAMYNSDIIMTVLDIGRRHYDLIIAGPRIFSSPVCEIMGFSMDILYRILIDVDANCMISGMLAVIPISDPRMISYNITPGTKAATSNHISAGDLEKFEAVMELDRHSSLMPTVELLSRLLEAHECHFMDSSAYRILHPDCMSVIDNMRSEGHSHITIELTCPIMPLRYGCVVITPRGALIIGMSVYRYCFMSTRARNTDSAGASPATE